MDYRLSLIKRGVAAHSDRFDLTLDGDLLVHLALRIEPPQCCSIQRSNSVEMRTANVILLGKIQQSGESLVSLVKDDGILFRRFSRVQQLNLHLGRSAPWNGFRRRDMIAFLLLRICHHGGHADQQQYRTKSLYFDHKTPCSASVFTTVLSHQLERSVPNTPRASAAFAAECELAEGRTAKATALGAFHLC